MRWDIYLRRFFYGIIICVLIYIIIFRRRSQQHFLTESDIEEFTKPTYVNITHKPRIPRIIHQMWKDNVVPDNWNETVQTVRQLNAHEFEYRVWTDVDMHEFVRREFPYLYQHTFLTYPLNIQRVDAFRYLVLYRMGGVYIDMDNGCRKSFDSLLQVLEAMDSHLNHTAAFPRTTPVGISNGFMITTQGHPLFEILISRLSLFNHNFLVDYLTVMLSAGPLYLSINEFYFDQIVHQSRIRIIDEIVYSSIYTWHTPGNSWHGRDARIILKIYHTWRMKSQEIVYSCFLIICCIMLLTLFCRRRKRYSKSKFYCYMKKMFLCRKIERLTRSEIKSIPI